MYCAKKEEQCKVGQYKEGNTCKDKTLTIIVRNHKESAPFPKDVCALSEENYLILNAGGEEKRLSACTEGSYIFTGAVSYSFIWRIKPTRDIRFRGINYGPANNLILAISKDYGAPWGFNFDGDQSLPDDFTTGEVVIENINVPYNEMDTNKKTEERFNESDGKEHQDRELLGNIKPKYNITNDITDIQCRFTDNKEVGFEEHSGQGEINDSQRSRSIKEKLINDGSYLSNFDNDSSVVDRTIILGDNTNGYSSYWSNGSGIGRFYRRIDHGSSEDNFYLGYVEVKGDRVIVHRYPVTCNTREGYIGPAWNKLPHAYGGYEERLDSISDFSIKLFNKRGVIKYNPKK